jgi:hypothetical protein
MLTLDLALKVYVRLEQAAEHTGQLVQAVAETWLA